VAFDPAEEQLDPPAQAIKLCRGQRRNAQVVAQEDEIPTVLFVEVSNLAQQGRKVSSCFRQRRPADLIAAYSRSIVHRQGSLAGKTQIVFGSCDKERTRLPDPLQAGEIHVAAVQDVKCSGLE